MWLMSQGGRISTSINEESCRIIHGLREFVNSKGGSYQNLMCQKPPLMAEIRQQRRLHMEGIGHSMAHCKVCRPLARKINN
jgi:hypothetical protein